MPAELGNKWANCKVDVSYEAEAVQYDHFTSWDDVDNNKITVESYEY
ncbi:hypothetical protein [Acetitomaculum ruminis]|nr:hypothetical protein [Acetitomaculum ruminis]